MAVAAIIAMRHHEEQLRKIHNGEKEEEVEGNDDIYATAQTAKKENESKGLLRKAFSLCCQSRQKILPEDDEGVTRAVQDDDTVTVEDDPAILNTYLLSSQAWPNVPSIFKCYLFLARYCKDIVESSLFNNGVTITIVLAGLNVGIQTYPGMDTNQYIAVLDYLILAIFTIELLLKFIMEGFRFWRFFIGPEWAWNNFDTAIVLLSYPIWGLEGGSSIALLRLVRLARLGKLIKKIPALNMIINGLAGGLSSITYIMILLFLVFYLYGVIGFYSFAANDPFHFGTLPLSMITLFRMATLENWGDIMFLNIYGCDVYPDMYVDPANETSENSILWCRYPSENWSIGPLYFVSFIVVAALVMLSLFIGAVTISMTESMMELKEMNAKKKALAAVEHNMKRMAAMAAKKAEEERKREKARKAKLKLLDRERKKAMRHANGDTSSIDGSLDGSITRGESPSPTTIQSELADKLGIHEGDDDDDADNSVDESNDLNLPDNITTKQGLKRMKIKYPYLSWWYQRKINALERIEVEAEESKEEIARALRIAIGIENMDMNSSEMKKDEAYVAKLEEQNSGISGLYLRFAKWNSGVVDAGWFQTFMTLVIIVASFNVGIQTDNRVMRHQAAVDTLDIMDTIILYVFTLEVIMKIFAENFTPWKYFEDSWNVFDFGIVAGSYVPGAGSSVTMLRLLRLLRVLKLVKRLPQLAVIINALLNGMVSIAYVGLVLMLFFYVFAIIGMLLFQANDPWHFGSLHMALFSLFQAATLDDWTILMYVQQYGCDKYAGVFEDFPEQCTKPKAYGLLAVLYFLIFILIGAQVLLSLFIGVISTSMDEAQESQAAEQQLEKKIIKTAQKLLLDQPRIEAMQFVFNKLDLDGGGSIEEEELKIGLDAIDAHMSEEDIVRILQKVSPDGGGVDSNGFILFMYETPMFSRTNAIQKISNAFGTEKSGKIIRKKKNFFYQFWTDIIYFGGTKNRIYFDQMEAALIIQDAWRERVAAIKAKRDTVAYIQNNTVDEQARRRTIMNGL